jgi:alkylation response protein AidB-like acyl-CoA dehydrogenase
VNSACVSFLPSFLAWSDSGISLLVVERGMPGFSTAKRLGKLGRHASDTCLLTFEDVRVPASNLIGNEGFGFFYMMQNLPQERLSIAIASMAAARRALALTTNYAHGRRAFGGVIGDFQTVQFTLARLRCEVQSATAFIDQCVTIMNEPLSAAQRRAGDLYALNAETASLAKVQSFLRQSRCFLLMCHGFEMFSRAVHSALILAGACD